MEVSLGVQGSSRSPHRQCLLVHASPRWLKSVETCLSEPLPTSKITFSRERGSQNHKVQDSCTFSHQALKMTPKMRPAAPKLVAQTSLGRSSGTQNSFQRLQSIPYWP